MLLLRHGLVGFCLGYVPVLAVIVWLIVKVLRQLGACLCDVGCCSLLFSAVLAFAASVVVGHVLQSPSVSLPAAAIYAQLLRTVSGKERAK